MLFKSSQGVMTFERKKPVFHNRYSKRKAELGLGVYDNKTFKDKGEYAFADIRNIYSVIPEGYFTVDYFENVGVPLKVSRGIYGGSILLKEEYKDKSIIKALDANANILLSETSKVKDTLENIHYTRIDGVVSTWEDITDIAVSKILASLRTKKVDLNISNPYILYALRLLTRNSILKTSNGVILASGRHETLALWGEGCKASMCWMGRHVTWDGSVIDIREDVLRAIRSIRIG